MTGTYSYKECCLEAFQLKRRPVVILGVAAAAVCIHILVACFLRPAAHRRLQPGLYSFQELPGTNSVGIKQQAPVCHHDGPAAPQLQAADHSCGKATMHKLPCTPSRIYVTTFQGTPLQCSVSKSEPECASRVG